MRSTQRFNYGLALICMLFVFALATNSERADNPPTVLAAEGAQAQIDVLAGLRREHPRILVTEADFAQTKQRIQNEPAFAERAAKLTRTANRILTEPVSTYEIPDGLRLLATSRRVLSRVQTLAFVFRMTGDRQYLDRAWDELDAAARFPDWNPRHFLDTAEMTTAFALGYDWLYSDLSDRQRATLRNAIIEKGLMPANEQYAQERDWTTDDSNWNAVCNGGIGLGAMAVADESPEIARTILTHAVLSLPYGLKGYVSDGGWDEGPGYWSYGSRYVTYFLAAAETALGTTFGFEASPGIAQTGYFPIYIARPTGTTFNYADGDDDLVSGAQLHWLARKLNQPVFAAYERQRGGVTALDLLWDGGQGDAAMLANLPLDRVFHSSEVATLRTAWNDENAIYAGLKAGNNKVGHEHLDIGTFVLDALGEQWAVELGKDDYNLPGYFDRRGPRYSYYRVRTEGQNTLVMNPSDAPDQSQTLSAPITDFASTGSAAFAVADMTPAYTQHATRATRGLMLRKEQRQIVLQDEVQASTPAEIWWFMHTRASISILDGGRSAMLTSGTKRLWAHIASGPEGAKFSTMDAKPLRTSPDPSGQNTNDGIRKLAIHLSNVSTMRLTVVFAPLEPTDTPPQILPTTGPIAEWREQLLPHRVLLPYMAQ